MKSTFTSATRHLVLSLLLLGIPGVSAQEAPQSVAEGRTKDPYKFVGLLSFTSDGSEFIGSATVIKPYSVLTAAHNLYSEGTGWSTEVLFERAYDRGTAASRSRASQLIILGGYSTAVDSGRGESTAGFSRDLGGFICFSRPAKGTFALWKSNPRLLTGSAYKMSLGYGAEIHSGEELLRSSSSRGFFKLTANYFANDYYGIESGMSGGPVFTRSGGEWVVCAVNVSGPGNRVDEGVGVRAIDYDASELIRNDLE